MTYNFSLTYYLIHWRKREKYVSLKRF